MGRAGFGWAPLGSCRGFRRDEWPGPSLPNSALWRWLSHGLQPSGEGPVLEQEGDQASELSAVFWGGVELVLELHKSTSSLELSSSSRFSLCSIAYLCTFSSTVGCQLSVDNSRRHRGSEERNACLLR
jgi:hypothetical protein